MGGRMGERNEDRKKERQNERMSESHEGGNNDSERQRVAWVA
jgi:hypothetical protein